jgi:hypothetical protein
MSCWTQVIAGLWIGDDHRPFRDEFDYVLTVADHPPATDRGLRHRWLPLTGDPHHLLDDATAWIAPRWQANRSLLIQSEGYQWAELTAAVILMHLGASPDEAAQSLRNVRADALTERYFLDLLRAREVSHD